MKLAQEYAELTAQEKAIKLRKTEISTEILDHMKENEIGSVKTSYGTFSKAMKRIYKYSDRYKKLEIEMKDNLKKVKKEEEDTQEPTIKEYLTFRLK